MSLSAEVRTWGCLDVLSNNLFLAYLANSPASTLCHLLLSPFNSISQLHEGMIRVSQAVRQSDATCTCVCIRVREGETPKRVISAGKTSMGLEMALAGAVGGRERAAAARSGPHRPSQCAAGPGCVVL